MAVSYIQHLANRLIPAANMQSILKVKRGNTADIMQVVIDCYKSKKDQLQKFAKHLKSSSDYNTCKNVWEFVKDNIEYKIDPPGQQWIKEPARVWKDKICDCKSYSVFIASALYHLHIPFKFRFVSFDKYNAEPTHVYIVATTEEGPTILDCVMPTFNSEAEYKHKADYTMTKISQLSGLTDSDEQKYEQLIAIRTAMQQEAWANGNNGMLPADRVKAYENAMDAVYGFQQTKINGIGPLPTPSDLNSIKSAIKSGPIAAQTLVSLFSKSGVSPSFFAMFSFLNFLDNSTFKWKSKAAFLKNKTPEERLAYFTDALNNGKEDPGLVITFYAGMYGPDTQSTGIRQSDDTTKIPYALAFTWNELVKSNFGKGGPDTNAIYLKNGDGYAGNRMLFDLTKCPDYSQMQAQINAYNSGATQYTQPQQPLLPQQQQLTTSTQPTQAGGNKIILLAALGLVGGYLLLKK